MKSHFLLFWSCLAAVVRSQTITTTDQFGESIVEVISTNPLAGALTTATIQTIAAQSTTSTSTTPDVQQGPVGLPAPTIPGQQTVYRYTTIDAAGDTTVITATFTPSFPPTQTPTPSTTGSILDYSSWLSLVGTNTVPVANAAVHRWRMSSASCGIGAGLAAGFLGGFWLVLA